MTTDPLFWFMAIAGVLITGISKSGFASGAGVVAVPLLSFDVGVLNATAIILPVLLLMDVQIVRHYWRSINWTELRGMAPAALLGITAGGLSMGYFSDSTLLLALGIVSVAFSMWGALQQFMANIRGARFFWSGVSGFTSTLVHAGGPPINIYLIARKLPKLQWLATAAGFFGMMNVVKLVPYTLNGQWQTKTFIISLALIPVTFAGVWAGRHLQNKLSEEAFVGACKALLFLSGLGLIAKGFWE